MSVYTYNRKKIKTYKTEVGGQDDINHIEENPRQVYRSKNLASILIPALLVLFGTFILYREIFPEIKQIIQENTGYYTNGTLSPVDEEYFDLSEYIARPNNLPRLTEDAMNLHILEPDTVSSKYNGTFYISIPALKMSRLPIKANVDSTTEESYMSILDYTLAHFQGTGLPISNVKNNIVVYGHSASMTYNPRPNDPMVAFSFLPELKVGDEIIIEIEDKTFTYRMFKSSIVEANETSIITGTRGKSSLTLFTCFPLGSDAKRYVAVARPV